MRTALFIPLTFICGVDGFAFFVPYLVVFLGLAYLLGRKSPRVATVPVASTHETSAPTLTLDK